MTNSILTITYGSDELFGLDDVRLAAARDLPTVGRVDDETIAQQITELLDKALAAAVIATPAGLEVLATADTDDAGAGITLALRAARPLLGLYVTRGWVDVANVLDAGETWRETAEQDRTRFVLERLVEILNEPLIACSPLAQARALDIRDGDLDWDVAHAVGAVAAAVNREGLASQIAYLIDLNGQQSVRELLERIARGREADRARSRTETTNG